MKSISTIPRFWNIREAPGVSSIASSPMKLATSREIGMEHDILLTRKDGSAKHYRIYGRPAPKVGDVVTLPIDGQLIKARVGEINGVASSRAEVVQTVDHIDALEFEEA
jgi:hypothetical protein